MDKKNQMMAYKGYHAVVSYSATDDIFVGEVFGIVDSLNFHGRSVDELKRMFRQCIDNYLGLCKKEGKPPEREFKGSFNVRISEELHRRAALAAMRHGISMNKFIEDAIEEKVEREDGIARKARNRKA